MSYLGDLLDQLSADIDRAMLGQEDFDARASDAWQELRIMADDMDRVLALPAAEKQAPTFRDATTFLTEVDGIVVGWTQCGRCGNHVKNCTCKQGPSEPKYIAKWIEEEQARRGTPVGVPETRDPVSPVFPVPVSRNAGSKPGDAFICGSCLVEKPDDEMDRNDDGTWTCYTCQEAS